MKKSLLIIAILFFGLVGYSAAQCATLKDGTIFYSSTHYLHGELIKPGFDIFGYNYQAHIFNSYYCNCYLGGDGLPPYEGDDTLYMAKLAELSIDPLTVEGKWYWPYRDTVVLMKWNDPWIASSDCDGNGVLDRHHGFDSYIGSGAWETNHQSGTYLGNDGKEYRWSYFCKIIAVPTTAVLNSGVWYESDGKEIGPSIWDSFAVIEEVYNDQGTGDHGRLYKSPARAGLGNWDY